MLEYFTPPHTISTIMDVQIFCVLSLVPADCFFITFFLQIQGYNILRAMLGNFALLSEEVLLLCKWVCHYLAGVSIVLCRV